MISYGVKYYFFLKITIFSIEFRTSASEGLTTVSGQIAPCESAPSQSIERLVNLQQISLIDFVKLTREIEELQHLPHKLYNYIYHSKELNRIVESMEYGKNSLKHHLLLMVNLVINGYYMGILKIVNGKLILTERKRNSASVTKKEALDRTKDAEMHQSLTMNNADSEKATTLMKEKARNIGKEKTIKNHLEKNIVR